MSIVLLISVIVDGPAIRAFPAFVILTIFIYPIEVNIFVSLIISYFASNFSKVSLAVAIIYPSKAYILGLSRNVT